MTRSGGGGAGGGEKIGGAETLKSEKNKYKELIRKNLKAN